MKLTKPLGILVTSGWLVVLLATLPELLRPSVLRSAVTQKGNDPNPSSVNRLVDPVELLRQALANFKTRGSQAKDYVYKIHFNNKTYPDITFSYDWEIMSVDGQPYRRHLGPNGLPLSPEEEKKEEARITASARLFVEIGRAAQLSRSDSDAATPATTEITKPQASTDTLVAAWVKMIEQFRSALARDAEEMRNGGPVNVIVWSGMEDVRQLTIPLETIPHDFAVRLKGHELLEGRHTFLIEANPRRRQKASAGDDLDGFNFKWKIWIDELDTEIVKLEGKADHRGLIARSEKVVFPYLNPPPECAAKLLQLMPESTVSYGAGTLIRMQWRKVNGEAWLPAGVQFKTTHLYKFPVCQGKDVEFHSDSDGYGYPSEYKIEFSDYKKFHVEVHILHPH